MPLTVFKRGEIYHYRGSVAGRRLRGTTKLKDKKAAQQFAFDLETKERNRDRSKPEPVLTFAKAAALYRKAGKSERFLDRVEDYWKTTPVKSITSGAVRNAAIVLCPNAKGATRNRHVIVPTQAIINHAAEHMGMGASVHGEREPAPWGSMLLHVPDRSQGVGSDKSDMGRR
jgi:hypothetical protein